MRGRGSNEFYGMALREIERGTRRDALWGRALAKSAGDLQKAKAEYIDMLALHLEEEACAPARRQKKQRMSSLIKRWSIRVAAIGVSVTLLGLYSAHFYRGYQLDWAAKVAERDYPPTTEPTTALVDAKGNRFLEPTWEQYYAVAVDWDTGTRFDSFTEVQRDLAEHNQVLMYQKYGEEAASRMIAGLAEALRVYSRATLNPPSFFDAIMDVLGFGTKSFR